MTLMEGLAIVGGVVLAAVLAHGAWNTRKATPRKPEQSAEGERREPALGTIGAAAAAGGETEAEALSPALSAAAQAARDSHPDTAAGLPAEALAELRPLAPRKTARLDPRVDAIATLALEAPVTGELALTHLPPSRRAGSKPFLIEGLNAATQAWELPAAGQRYAAFQAGVQLANRSGALNEIEYSEFVQKLQAFGDSVSAMVDAPDMLEVVKDARELDRFASEHDAQLAITLRASGPAWTVGYLHQIASRHGFVPGVLPGRLVRPGAQEGEPPVLVLSFDAQAALADDPNAAAVRRIQLSLDVPQTPESAEPFPLWHETARRLAADMGADMIDDQGRLITLHAFAGIGEDLKRLYQALAAREVPAGSAAARRLFS